MLGAVGVAGMVMGSIVGAVVIDGSPGVDNPAGVKLPILGALNPPKEILLTDIPPSALRADSAVENADVALF